MLQVLELIRDRKNICKCIHLPAQVRFAKEIFTKRYCPARWITNNNKLLPFIYITSPVSSVADPDPGSGAFLTPGSGIRYEQPGSYFLELRNYFFGFLGLKYLNSLMRIRDPEWRQFGSGIRDGKKSDPRCLSRIRNTACITGGHST